MPRRRHSRSFAFLSGFRSQLSAFAILLLAGCVTAPTEYHAPAALTAADRTAHNLAVFDRDWTLVNERYFDPKFRGVDWAAMPAKYRSEAGAAADDDALYRVLNRMNAELKESHLSAITPRRVHEHATERQAAVGLRWVVLDGKRVVIDIVPGGPAAAAGVRLGWVVTSRNGTPIKDADPYIPHVGQPVTYGFLDERDEPRTLTLEPMLVNFVRHEARVLPDGVLYLRFDEFDHESLSWLSDHLKTRPPPRSVVIDLRYNPGGNALALSVAVAEFFAERVPEGRLIQRNGAAREANSFSWLSARYAGRVVLLTGRQTGSAAEIFSHVLQYHGRAKVVGQPTAGAVIYSRTWSLPGGGQIQVPIIDYIGLDGKRLEGRGVTPNVVAPAVTLADLRAGRDPDLETALNLLH
jgi:carboxyl-terminal processing protease